MALPSSLDVFMLALSETGEVTDEYPLPLSKMADVDPILRTPFAATSEDGRTWSVAFPFGNLFFIYRGTEAHCQGRLVEGRPFPVDVAHDRRRDPVWVVDLALSRDRLIVLPRGQTRDAMRLLDEYSLDDCAYVRSIRLPRSLQAMAHDGEAFLFNFEDPSPALLGLRPRDTRMADAAP